MDTDRIREDFPLTQEVIYLDNASTSLSPKLVIDTMLEYETHYRANVGRGVHRLSQIAGQLYRDAHEAVNRFIVGEEGIPVFVRNCTEAINMVSRGLTFQDGDEIIPTITDHHSNLLLVCSPGAGGHSKGYHSVRRVNRRGISRGYCQRNHWTYPIGCGQ